MKKFKQTAMISPLSLGGGASVQANWEQNDSNATDYVKGRTHYSNILIDLEFNGDFSNAIDGMIAKVSDTFYDVNDLLGADATLNYAGQEAVYTIKEEDLIAEEFEGFKMVSCTVPGLPEGTQCLISINMEMEGIPAGTYIFNINNSIYISKVFKGEIKQLDEIYIPNYENLATKEEVSKTINRRYEYIGTYNVEANNSNSYVLKLEENTFSKVYAEIVIEKNDNFETAESIWYFINQHDFGTLSNVCNNTEVYRIKMDIEANGLLINDYLIGKNSDILNRIYEWGSWSRKVQDSFDKAEDIYVNSLTFRCEKLASLLPKMQIRVWGVRVV